MSRFLFLLKRHKAFSRREISVAYPWIYYFVPGLMAKPKPRVPMMEIYQDEKNLIFRLVHGDRKAFEVIYHSHAAGLIRYAQKSIDNKEDCEGIVQEVFEWLWANHHTLRHLTSVRGYLFKMVRYKIIDHLRRSKVRKRYEAHYLLFVAGQSHFTEPTHSPADIKLLIDQSVSRLPERCQKAFRLRFDDNLPYRDIALHMQISTKTVEKHISAALQHLRSAYLTTYKRVNTE